MVKSRFDLYNPFDDMILDDPAYAADAGDFQAIQPVAPVNVNVNTPYRAGQTYQEIISRPEVQQQIEQGSQTMADIARGPINLFGDVMARTLGIIAENMVNDEAAQRGRERFQNQKEAAKMFGTLYSQLTPDQIQFYEQRTGKSTQRPSSLAEGFSQGFNYTLDFILREAIDGSKEIRAGKNFTELPGAQQLGVGLLPLEFWLGGGGARKVVQETGGELLQKYKDMQLSELVANPQAQKEIPEVIEAVKREYPVLEKFSGPRLTTERPSDMDLTLSQMEAQDQRGMRFLSGKPRTGKPRTGKPVRPTGKGGQSREYIDYRNSQTNQLVNIIKQNKPEDQNLSLNELIAKYDIQEQFDKSEPGRLKLKRPVRKILKEQLGEKQYEDLYKLAMAKGRTKRSEANTLQLLQLLKTIDDETFQSKTAMAQSLAYRNAGIDYTNIIKRYNKDENVRTLMDQFINPSDPSGRSKDVFNRVFKDANDQQLDNFFNVPLSQINPTSMAQVQDLIKRMGIKDFKSERKLLRNFLYDRYRSIKGSKGFENLKEKDFLNRKYSQEQIDDMQEQFENYIDVERDRLYLQIVGRKVLEELSQNPRYKPYLQSLLNPDELDEIIVRGNKTHDQPMFVTRVKGKDRLKKTGRFVNTGTEPEFLNAHFQPYNRLQVDLDPTAAKIADVMTQKGLKQKLEKMPVNVIKPIKVKGKFKTPTSRTNFISEGILEILKDRGVNIDPSKYDNQYQLIEAVHDGIQKIYEERLIRTVVPTQNKAERTNYIFGVDDPKEFTMDQKIENHIERLVETFENAIENNISPEELRTGKGYMKLRKGGPVKMAMGGDPLTNLNQQQFAPDPAFEGPDYFSEAVESGNLYAFNPTKLFKLFGKDTFAK